MQKYRELAQQVQEIYQQAGSVFNSYQQNSGLTCLAGCGKCCTNPDVSASMLEMLPLAIELIDQGTALEVYERLQKDLPFCLLYQPSDASGLKGQCAAYRFRPSICRSFGAAARISKDGSKQWLICKLIKENHLSDLADIDIQKAPILGFFASQIATLDSSWGNKLYPINIALKLMLEKLLLIQSFI